jgi:hypothetical protein
MPKITEIKASYGLTKNLGNFESLRLDITLSATITDGEDIDEAWGELMKEARQKLIDASKTEEELLRNW